MLVHMRHRLIERAAATLAFPPLPADMEPRRRRLDPQIAILGGLRPVLHQPRCQAANRQLGRGRNAVDLNFDKPAGFIMDLSRKAYIETIKPQPVHEPSFTRFLRALSMASSIATRRKSAFFTSPRTASIRSAVPSLTRKANCSVNSLGRVTRRDVAGVIPLVESPISTSSYPCYPLVDMPHIH